MSTESWVILAIVIIAVIWIVSIYNKLVSYKTQYQNGFEQISVQLKRRLDLIGNLVDVANKYMEHEKDVLLSVTQARAGLAQATDAASKNPGDAAVMENLATSQTAVNTAMGGFNMRMEAYPDLKANENMMQLSEELTTTENRIAASRQGYNDLVQKFNEYKKSFPPLVFVNLFGFQDDAKSLAFEETLKELNKAPKNLFG